MFITVVICTRNRAESLRRTLESLCQPKNLEANDWEMLVVDNGSTDHTCDVCRNFGERFPKHFRSAVETKVGKSNALNAGIAAARGDVLAFTDDDVICAPGFVPGIREFFTEIPAEAVQGRVFLDCEGGQPDWLDSHLALTAGFRDCGEKVVDLEGTLFGLNMIIRAEVFRKIGGFSPCLGPGQLGLAEDTELSLRMRRAGMRLMYAPQILVYHRLARRRLTRGFIRERFFQEGRATAFRDELPVSLFHFGLYVVKEAISRELRAIGYRRKGRPASALRQECEAYRQAGFFWQHVCFKRGVSSHLSLSPLPSRQTAVSSEESSGARKCGAAMLNRSPKVSVCIPTYNRAGMLRESAASVLGQTLQDFELIISDNASEDDTKSVVRCFNDKRIRYFRNSRNLGPRENINRCLLLSRGKYIAFLPDDDIMMPGNLALKVDVLDANPEVGLVHSSYHLINQSGCIVKANTNWGHGPDRTLDVIEDRRELLAAMYNRINLPTVLFRRACYEKLGGFTGGFADEIGLAFDYEYWMRIALYHEIAFLARPLVKWRIHGDSLTNKHLASDETRKLRQVLTAKRFLLTTCSGDIPRDLRQIILDRARAAVLMHSETALEKEMPSARIRMLLFESARMFPEILFQGKTWKLLLKSMMSRQSLERLKRVAPT